jgi:hypothetical protein
MFRQTREATMECFFRRCERSYIFHGNPQVQQSTILRSFDLSS